MCVVHSDWDQTQLSIWGPFLYRCSCTYYSQFSQTFRHLLCVVSPKWPFFLLFILLTIFSFKYFVWLAIFESDLQFYQIESFCPTNIAIQCHITTPCQQNWRDSFIFDLEKYIYLWLHTLFSFISFFFAQNFLKIIMWLFLFLFLALTIF